VAGIESPCRSLLNAHWCSVAVQATDEARNLSPYTGLKACTGAESGYNDKQESVKEAGAKCKNRDKFIYFIVRVRLRSVIQIIMQFDPHFIQISFLNVLVEPSN
jgi:hypothetical protein